jgi:hypothetical protein
MPAYARPLLRRAARGALGVGLACAAVSLALAALEFGYRAHSHRPVLTLGDWRAGRIAYLAYGERNAFDPVLGWVPHAGYDDGGRSTIDLGIRRNFAEDEIRTGGILAVGDVFTAGGAEVEGGETWPAQLERITGQPVLNAGVRGHGIDQTVLRAEQLLARTQPKTLVVGLFEGAIARAGLSSYGTSKPTFTLENGKLVFHAPVRAVPDVSSAWIALLARSAVVDTVASRLAPEAWLGKVGSVDTSVDNDPAGVACALIERLKGRADGDGVRLLLLVQYARQTVTDEGDPDGAVRKVAACAGAAGVEIVDQLPALRAVAAADRDTLDRLYLEDGDGQMSPEGNRRTAELLAGALRK